MKVLVVDDEEDVLVLLSTMLANYGFEVETTTLPDKIYKSILMFEPEAILLDINLGNISGVEVCKGLKSHNRTKHIPIILVSGDPEIKDKCAECNADNCIGKPVDFDKLVKLIKGFI